MSSRGICISKNDFSYSINKLVLWKSEYTDDTIQASEGYRVGKQIGEVAVVQNEKTSSRCSHSWCKAGRGVEGTERCLGYRVDSTVI